MKQHRDVILAYSIMLGLIILVGFLQSWSIALSILVIVLLFRPSGIFKGKVI